VKNVSGYHHAADSGGFVKFVQFVVVSLAFGGFAGMSARLMAQTPVEPADPDPYRWLEEVQSERALDWARERNKHSQTLLEAQPGFKEEREKILGILNNREQIPYISRQGNYFINFWRDAGNPRGIWRRTTLDEYRKAKPEWETLLNLDTLAKVENENWVWGGADCLAPSYNRCMVSLSRGGLMHG
jgi:prolyl oligopeptidase